jgi:hypothetical protein
MDCITTEMSCSRIRSLSCPLIVFAVSAACIGATIASESKTGTAEDCQTGTYRFLDGQIIDVAQSEGRTLRWRKFDGTRQVTLRDLKLGEPRS